MARAKSKRKTITTAKITKTNSKVSRSSVSLSKPQNWLEQLNLSESYVSLLLGAVVVFVLSVVFFMFIRESSFNNSTTFPQPNPVPTSVSLEKPRTYTLLEGEGLWDVAVKFYGDGFRWTEIAKANNLTEEQANALGPGAKVIIPNLK